jgi:ABC-2 type transport system permease protein
MNRPVGRLRAAMVVARRDFLAIVGTPTFLVFLLAPLLFMGLSALGSQSAASLVQNADATQRIVAVVPASERAAFQATDARLRELAPGRTPPQLVIVPADNAHGAMVDQLQRNPDVSAILTGSAERPRIAEREGGGAAGRYLALLADSVARGGTSNAAVPDISVAERVPLGGAQGSGRAAQAGLGYGAVFVLFLLILLLGGQTVGTLAEEKGNKVIEILAAAVPMESVFFGKLVGMLGVALLFVAFWGSLITLAGSAVLSQIAEPEVLSQVAVQPAVGWPLFLLLGFLYFLMGFMLLGAMFLGLGALASSVREIQMLSLPITLFQVGMFTLGSATANAPGTQAALIAQWLPWSSPFAMAARGATDPTLWPHVIALGWQALWLMISIVAAVRLFRFGVLRSGPLIPWLTRRQPPPAGD